MPRRQECGVPMVATTRPYNEHNQEVSDGGTCSLLLWWKQASHCPMQCKPVWLRCCIAARWPAWLLCFPSPYTHRISIQTRNSHQWDRPWTIEVCVQQRNSQVTQASTANVSGPTKVQRWSAMQERYTAYWRCIESSIIWRSLMASRWSSVRFVPAALHPIANTSARQHQWWATSDGAWKQFTCFARTCTRPVPNPIGSWDSGEWLIVPSNWCLRQHRTRLRSLTLMLHTEPDMNHKERAAQQKNKKAKKKQPSWTLNGPCHAKRARATYFVHF